LIIFFHRQDAKNAKFREIQDSEFCFESLNSTTLQTKTLASSFFYVLTQSIITEKHQ
tara:strand:+ start:451 stop:621 length:171 start_codon:yes stop_codon:yes gene_type:complete